MYISVSIVNQEMTLKNDVRNIEYEWVKKIIFRG